MKKKPVKIFSKVKEFLLKVWNAERIGVKDILTSLLVFKTIFLVNIFKTFLFVAVLLVIFKLIASGLDFILVHMLFKQYSNFPYFVSGFVIFCACMSMLDTIIRYFEWDVIAKYFKKK